MSAKVEVLAGKKFKCPIFASMNATQSAQITEFLSREIPGLMGVYLFGSRAGGTANAESDFDIAILTERPGMLDGMRRFELGLELGEILGSTVDMVDLQAAQTDFRFVIISTSERIYCRDTYFCDFFEMTAYSMYQDLELFRREIIEDIKKRGSVYG